jgi:hypothetical protein
MSVMIVGRALEHRRELVGDEDDEQHTGDGEPSQRHFAQDIAIQRAEHIQRLWPRGQNEYTTDDTPRKL